MPSCTICTHSQRNEIEKLLIKGQSERVIANQFSITQGSLHRHKDSHLDKTLLKARELEEMLHADDLLGQIKHLQREAYDNLELAKGERDVKSISMALREARG
ncbi:hypothetical protein MYX76_16670, partial [Desulfobacterota bacterium AH_259_B03_O07]|nr:hypothetical protein [Desulfobacterota bacterium AH_259_B03_O07]